jgi:hypothetical protein
VDVLRIARAGGDPRVYLRATGTVVYAIPPTNKDLPDDPRWVNGSFHIPHPKGWKGPPVDVTSENRSELVLRAGDGRPVYLFFPLVKGESPGVTIGPGDRVAVRGLVTGTIPFIVQDCELLVHQPR